MASTSRHLKQWKHNRDFLPLIPADFTDWLITVTFYTALHAVDALLAADNVPRLTNHQARNAVLRETNAYEKIWRNYRPLYDLSQSVRYLAAPDQWVPVHEMEGQILGRYLYPIEHSVRRLLVDRKAITEIEMPTDKVVLLT